ncbi:putative fatty acyl-CoA reductase-like protein [Leptotrombidium deliense]|uniref:Fatty acyl-CoA reductase n=1 Tax=Leptotrombidium deliense TaxID=299467 RepID=A0A443STA7_9ACAR|nr:putative fatty acyl-CoA reductase-like protein [Leptotrombidium deliense]
MPERVVREVIYPLPFDVNSFLDDFQRLSESELQAIYSEHIDGYINSYHLTKSIAEVLIKQECFNVPVVIVRPSVVMSANTEPEPGWFQGLQLSTGLMAVWTSGLIRTIVAHEDFATPIIPVDLLGNFILAAIYQKFKSNTRNITIYNCTTNCENSPTMPMLAYYYGELAEMYPSCKMIRTPLRYIPKSRNKFTYKVKKITHHTLFSYFADCLLKLKGEKAM